MRSGSVVQLIKSLSSMHEDLSSVPHTPYDQGASTCLQSQFQGAIAGELQLEVIPGYRVLEAGLGWMRYCLITYHIYDSCASAPSCGSLCLHANNVLSYTYSRTVDSHLFAPPVVSAGLGIYRTAVQKLEGGSRGKPGA